MAQPHWDPDSTQFLYPELQYTNFTGDGCKSIWDDGQLCSTPTSWRLPDSESPCSEEFNRKNSSSSISSYANSTATSVSLSEIDWDSMIEDDVASGENNSVQDRKELEDLEDWAWMESSPCSLSGHESKFDMVEGHQKISRTSVCSNKKDTKFLPVATRKSRSPRDLREDHNAIERKYRENINLKLSELGQWLTDHPSSSDLGMFGLMIISLPLQTRILTTFVGPRAPLKKITKFTTIAEALDRLEYLSRCNKSLEDQRAAHRQQIAGLKRIVRSQRKQQRLVGNISGA